MGVGLSDTVAGMGESDDFCDRPDDWITPGGEEYRSLRPVLFRDERYSRNCRLLEGRENFLGLATREKAR